MSIGHRRTPHYLAAARVGSLVIAAALIAGATAADAQDTDPTVPADAPDQVPVDGIDLDPFIDPFPLEIGPWSAVGSTQGTATASEQGVNITWTGRIPAQFDFAISDGGVATGTWQHQGSAIQKLSGTAGGQSMEATGTLRFNGGGTVAGDNSQLRLTGSSTTEGSVVASTPAGSISIPVGSTNPLPTLRLDIAAVSCDEAYGEWAYTVAQAFEGEGFSAEFGGYWHGFRGSDAVNQNVSQLIGAIAVDPTTGEGGELVSQSPLMGMSAAILVEYNSFVDSFPGWTLAQVLDIATRTEALLTAMRNLTECDKRLFGEENVEIFVDGLTFALQGLIIGAPPGSYTSRDFQNLVHIAVRNGALGPGAPNPAQAVNAETALIRAAEAILEANLDPADNLIFVNDDTTRVMATAAAMGWGLTVGGITYDARGTYENALGDTWQATAPATGDGE